LLALARCARLGGGALDRLLVEDASATGTHLLLDLVRDPGALQKHMDAFRDVLVNLDDGPLAHLFLNVKDLPVGVWSKRVKFLQLLGNS